VPPENAGFMIAAYTVAAVIIVIYAVSLAVRLKGAGKTRSGL
jgi:hypothetical protein